jgi:hypothetical protein
MDFEASKTYLALPEHAKSAWLKGCKSSSTCLASSSCHRRAAEGQSRWDGQFIGGLSKLTTAVERHEELAQIPIGVPDAVPKKT